jgi:hypothetical protein
MAKRITSDRFNKNQAKVAKFLSNNREKHLYFVVENRKRPDDSFCVVNIHMFAALCNATDDALIQSEARVVIETLKDIKRKMSQSYRERVLKRFDDYETLIAEYNDPMAAFRNFKEKYEDEKVQKLLNPQIKRLKKY